MSSRIIDRLGVRHPIIQAPMGGVTNTDLIAAVANAGCVGMHAVSWATATDIDALFAATRAASTGVFGANLVLEWDQQERLDVLVANECKLVSFFWGDPAPYLDKARANGMTTMLTVGTAAEARHAADIGIDIVVAQGWEAGGHVWSDVSTIALVPAIAKNVPEIPVVAAGGIGSGRAMAAAFALGAEAVWIGTRFLASTEALAHPGYKDLLVDADESSTAHGYMFDGGWPDAAHRVLKSKVVDMAISGEEKDRALIGRLPSGEEMRRFDDYPPVEGMTGAWEETALYAGQSVGQVDAIKSVDEIVTELLNDARTAVESIDIF